MTGHWELMGLNIKTPFRVFPDGFPQELLDRISEFSGRGSYVTYHTVVQRLLMTTVNTKWKLAI